MLRYIQKLMEWFNIESFYVWALIYKLMCCNLYMAMAAYPNEIELQKFFIEFYWIEKGYLQMVYKSEKWKLSNTTQEDSTTLAKAGTPAMLYQWEVTVAHWTKLFCFVNVWMM